MSKSDYIPPHIIKAIKKDFKEDFKNALRSKRVQKIVRIFKIKI